MRRWPRTGRRRGSPPARGWRGKYRKRSWGCSACCSRCWRISGPGGSGRSRRWRIPRARAPAVRLPRSHPGPFPSRGREMYGAVRGFGTAWPGLRAGARTRMRDPRLAPHPPAAGSISASKNGRPLRVPPSPSRGEADRHLATVCRPAMAPRITPHPPAPSRGGGNRHLGTVRRPAVGPRITPHPPASGAIFASKNGNPSRAPPSPSMGEGNRHLGTVCRLAMGMADAGAGRFFKKAIAGERNSASSSFQDQNDTAAAWR